MLVAPALPATGSACPSSMVVRAAGSDRVGASRIS